MTDEQTPLLGDHPTAASTAGRDTNLAKFRRAIGINSITTANTLDGDIEAARKGAIGLYASIIRQQKCRSLQFHAVEAAYYIALGSQIVIGATLASLGPLSKLHPTAITVLGIVNTSIAGVLVVFKGQGLPDRLRKDEYQMRKVQDFIEEMDVKLALETDDSLTAEELEAVVQAIFEKYNTAVDTAEMNRPSSYAHQVESSSSSRDGAIARFLGPRDAEADGDNADSQDVGNDKGNGKGRALAKAKFVID